MSFEEVIKLVGPPNMSISRTGAKNEMYRWTNEAGDSYMARFENGKLVHKTKLNVEEEAAPKGEGKRITMKQYNQIEKGMSEDRISKILGIKAELVASNNYNLHFYKWTDSTGTNFTGKFLNNRLDSITGLLGPASAADNNAPPDRQQQSSLESLEEPPQSQPLRGSLSPEEIEEFIAARRPAALDTSAPAPAEEENVQPRRQVQRITSIAPEQRAPQVAVVGSQRAPDDDPYADRSYKPRAKLPDFRHSLRRGVYEIRVVNESDSSAKVGLRAGKRGEDLTVPAGGDASFKVDRGRYAFHYLYKDDPYTLYSGDPIAIDGQNVADIEVLIQDGTYTVNTLHELFVPNRTPLDEEESLR
jgi:hypothetical protein